jgi:hypothetical protein
LNILEPQELLRRVKLTRECLEHQKKTISPTIARLSGDLALHNARIAEEKLETLLAGLGNMICAYRVEEKETEPLRPLEN